MGDKLRAFLLCGQIILYILPVIFFVLRPFRENLRFSLKVTGIIILFMVILEIIVDYCQYLHQASFLSVLLHPLMHIPVFLVLLRKKHVEFLFVLFLVMNYENVLYYVTRFWGINFLHGATDSMIDTISMFAGIMVIQILHIIFLYGYLKNVLLPMFQIRYTITKNSWFLLWLVPFSFYVISCYVSYEKYTDEQNIGLTTGYVMMSTILAFFICWLIGNFLKESEDEARLEMENNYLSMAARQDAEIQSSLEQTRRLRHDIRHFLVTVNGLIDSGNLEAVRDCLLNYNSALSEITPQFYNYSPSKAVNVVLCYYLSLARQSEIDVACDCVMETQPAMPDLELCSIIGNLLENAVEACRRQESGRKFIHLTLKKESGAMLVLIVENSFCGTIKEKRGHFLSSKREGYGIGLASVAALTEKNDGILKIEYENEIFKVSMLLK